MFLEVFKIKNTLLFIFRRQYTDDAKREAEKEEGEIVYLGHKYYVPKVTNLFVEVFSFLKVDC